MSFNKLFLVLTVQPTGAQEPQTFSYPLSYSRAVRVQMTIAPQQARDLSSEFRAEFPWCFCCQLIFRDMSLKPYFQSTVMFSAFALIFVHYILHIFGQGKYTWA